MVMLCRGAVGLAGRMAEGETLDVNVRGRYMVDQVELV
jgi:hypothetical protein